jgi:hypothetical protein
MTARGQASPREGPFSHPLRWGWAWVAMAVFWGVFAYRVLAFWLLLPVSLAALPTLRMMSAPGKPSSGGEH